jgi:hypothetical protein
MAAHNWRALRTKALENGHSDLMAWPNMHVVLDAMEQLGLESAVAGAKTQIEAKTAMSSYYDKLYKPDITAMVINGDGYLPPPPGFSEEEMEASFDAFLSSGTR